MAVETREPGGCCRACRPAGALAGKQAPDEPGTDAAHRRAERGRQRLAGRWLLGHRRHGQARRRDRLRHALAAGPLHAQAGAARRSSARRLGVLDDDRGYRGRTARDSHRHDGGLHLVPQPRLDRQDGGDHRRHQPGQLRARPRLRLARRRVPHVRASFDHRVDRFEEALRIISPLVRTGRASFEGEYYQAREAINSPAARAGARAARPSCSARTSRA